MLENRFDDMNDTELLRCILAAAGQEGSEDTIQELISRNKGYWRKQFNDAGLIR